MSSEITVAPVNVAWIDQRHSHDISLQMRTFYQSYSVVMARNNPFYFPLSTSKESYGGVDTALVQALSQSLQANFTISMSPVRSWGSCGSRGNCSGMLGMLQRNEFDIALSGMSLSYERHRVIDFSFPYLVDRITFAVRPPQLLDPADAIIRPFSPEVWLYLAATIGVSLIVRCASLRLPEKFHGFVSLLEIHGLLLGKGCRWVPSLVSQRLLFCLWLMLSLVLSASYSGKLFSSMTHPGLENIIDTIDELANALKKGTIVCGTIRGTDFEKALQQEHPLSPVNQLILHSLISDDNAVGNDAEGLQRVQRERYAYIGEYIGVLADLSRFDSVYFAPDSFQMGAYGIAMRKGLGITKPVNLLVMHLWEAGLVGVWLKNSTNWFSDNEWAAVQTPDPLTYSQVIGAVHIMSAGVTASLIAIILEIVVYYRTVKQDKKFRAFMHHGTGRHDTY